MFSKIKYLKLKSVIVLIFFQVFNFIQLSAQIFPVSSHTFRNTLSFNPAFTGASDGLNLVAGYRNQWTGLEGAPKGFYVNGDLTLPRFRSGIGLSMWSEKIGVQNINSVNANYAYIQPLGKIKLSVGVELGAVFSTLDGAKLITPNGVYENGGVNHEDPVLPASKVNSIKPSLGIGVLVQHDNFDFAIASMNLIDFSDKFTGIEEQLNANYERPFHVFLRGKINLGTKFDIQPSVSVLTDFKNWQTEISALASWQKTVYLGVSARGYNKNSFESLIPIVGGRLWKDLTLFYSYDVNLNSLKVANKGSHEVSLGYYIPSKKFFKGEKIVNNPRFL